MIHQRLPWAPARMGSKRIGANIISEFKARAPEFIEQEIGEKNYGYPRR